MNLKITIALFLFIVVAMIVDYFMSDEYNDNDDGYGPY